MKLYPLLILNLFLLFSCKKYKPADAAFFWKPKLVSVSANPITQGSSSSKISDLFLYIDGQYQGAYPVGSLMPIITNNKKVTINMFAGIKNNGISTTRISWIFYNYLTLDTLVEAGKTIDRPVTFKYNPNVKFEWLENFDSNTGITLKQSGNDQSDTTFKIASAADSFEGRSIELGLVRDSSQAQIESTISYSLPTGSSDVYLEINYKCNSAFEVGVIGDALPVKAALIVNPQENWNKIYIELANVINQAPVSTRYKIYFRMISTSSNTHPKLFLDNIKLIHF